MSFRGFGADALPFFRALAFHQSREWFEANRATYERAIRAPMGDLVEDVAERLRRAKIPIKGDRKSSVFRIHRDVRFSASKDPYKTHAGAVLTRSGAKDDSGVIYFHLSPDGCFFGAGFHNPDPPGLARLRGSAARAPKAFLAMTAKLKKTGLVLSDEDSLRRAPRGFEAIDDTKVAAAVRLKRFVCDRPVAAKAIRSAALVDDFAAFARDASPLLEWGWDALGGSR